MNIVMKTYDADTEINTIYLDENYQTEMAEIEKLRSGMSSTIDAISQLSVYHLCERENCKEYWDSWAYHKDHKIPYPKTMSECKENDAIIVTPVIYPGSETGFQLELILKNRNGYLIGSTEISIPLLD